MSITRNGVKCKSSSSSELENAIKKSRSKCDEINPEMFACVLVCMKKIYLMALDWIRYHVIVADGCMKTVQKTE